MTRRHHEPGRTHMSTLSEAEREAVRFAVAHWHPNHDEGSRLYEVVESIVAARVEAALVEREEVVSFPVGKGWPTPNNCLRVADALDAMTPARYGDILRAYAHAEERRYGIERGPVKALRPTPEPCRWTNGGAPACSETRDDRYWCEPCRERREVGA
jgi:hypothetical protein